MGQLEKTQQQLAFLGLTTQDQENLARLAPTVEKHADSLVAAFYRHLLGFEPTRRLLSDPDIKERLLGKQRIYLLSLVRPTLDDEYFRERISIGRAHMDVGLEPRWYLGSYMLYVRLLIPLINETFASEPGFAQRATLSLLKVLSLDSQLAMESYMEGRSKQLEYLNRELAEASLKLEKRYDAQAEELRETAARAQAAEQLASIATIVAGLAHEIGTPMGVIQGHAELLESSVTDDRGRKRLATIRDQIERISHIIQTLLNMARPHAPERTLVPLERLIDETLAFLQEKFFRRKIRAMIDFRARATLLGSSERLQQLFLNLFLNAADSMLDGGELHLVMEAVPGDRPAVEIYVSDTGHGIPEDIRSRIFEPFFTTKAAGRGSGLGLMVAKGIVMDHGGTIDVTSQVDHGTEIRILLPCKEVRPLDPEAGAD